jgi:hypothetical protein
MVCVKYWAEVDHNNSTTGAKVAQYNTVYTPSTLAQAMMPHFIHGAHTRESDWPHILTHITPTQQPGLHDMEYPHVNHEYQRPDHPANIQRKIGKSGMIIKSNIHENTNHNKGDAQPFLLQGYLHKPPLNKVIANTHKQGKMMREQPSQENGDHSNVTVLINLLNLQSDKLQKGTI